jgi:TonB family protein
MRYLACAALVLAGGLAHAQTPPAVPMGIADAYTHDEPGITRPRLGVNPSSLAAMMAYFYPAESLRAREEGEVTLIMCVTETGKVVSPQLLKSSGFPRLDSASHFFMRGLPLKPATLDGKDVPFCGYHFGVVWALPYGYSQLEPPPAVSGDREAKKAGKDAALSPDGSEP